MRLDEFRSLNEKKERRARTVEALFSSNFNMPSNEKSRKILKAIYNDEKNINRKYLIPVDKDNIDIVKHSIRKHKTPVLIIEGRDKQTGISTKTVYMLYGNEHLPKNMEWYIDEYEENWYCDIENEVDKAKTVHLVPPHILNNIHKRVNK